MFSLYRGYSMCYTQVCTTFDENTNSALLHDYVSYTH